MSAPAIAVPSAAGFVWPSPPAGSTAPASVDFPGLAKGVSAPTSTSPSPLKATDGSRCATRCNSGWGTEGGQRRYSPPGSLRQLLHQSGHASLRESLRGSASELTSHSPSDHRSGRSAVGSGYVDPVPERPRERTISFVFESPCPSSPPWAATEDHLNLVRRTQQQTPHGSEQSKAVSAGTDLSLSNRCPQPTVSVGEVRKETQCRSPASHAALATPSALLWSPIAAATSEDTVERQAAPSMRRRHSATPLAALPNCPSRPEVTLRHVVAVRRPEPQASCDRDWGTHRRDHIPAPPAKTKVVAPRAAGLPTPFVESVLTEPHGGSTPEITPRLQGFLRSFHSETAGGCTSLATGSGWSQMNTITSPTPVSQMASALPTNRPLTPLGEYTPVTDVAWKPEPLFRADWTAESRPAESTSNASKYTPYAPPPPLSGMSTFEAELHLAHPWQLSTPGNSVLTGSKTSPARMAPHEDASQRGSDSQRLTADPAPENCSRTTRDALRDAAAVSDSLFREQIAAPLRRKASSSVTSRETISLEEIKDLVASSKERSHGARRALLRLIREQLEDSLHERCSNSTNSEVEPSMRTGPSASQPANKPTSSQSQRIPVAASSPLALQITNPSAPASTVVERRPSVSFLIAHQHSPASPNFNTSYWKLLNDIRELSHAALKANGLSCRGSGQEVTTPPTACTIDLASPKVASPTFGESKDTVEERIDSIHNDEAAAAAEMKFFGHLFDLADLDASGTTRLTRLHTVLTAKGYDCFSREDLSSAFRWLRRVEPGRRAITNSSPGVVEKAASSAVHSSIPWYERDELNSSNSSLSSHVQTGAQRLTVEEGNSTDAFIALYFPLQLCTANPSAQLEEDDDGKMLVNRTAFIAIMKSLLVKYASS